MRRDQPSWGDLCLPGMERQLFNLPLPGKTCNSPFPERWKKCSVTGGYERVDRRRGKKINPTQIAVPFLPGPRGTTVAKTPLGCGHVSCAFPHRESKLPWWANPPENKCFPHTDLVQPVERRQCRVMLGSVLLVQPLIGGHFLSFAAGSKEMFTGDFSWTSWTWDLFWECGCSLSSGAEEQ